MADQNDQLCIESIKESFDQPSAARTVASLSLLLRPAFFVMCRFSTHYRGKGLFFGEQLEIELDAMIRKSRKIQRLLAHMPFDVASGRAKITFGHVKAAELKSRAETGTNAIYFPPLLLTSTNVTRRKLIIIDSRDGEFQDLPVARAARISGSFPLFFRPVELANPGDASNPGAVGKPPDLLVDGGVISNFPLWVFGKGFRQRLYRDKDAEWDFLTRLPWQHIGLRRSDDEAQYTSPDDSLAYLKSLAALLTGGARDELEALLEQTMDQRPWIVAQRTAEADGPPNVLDIDQLNKHRVLAMVQKGAVFAIKRLSKMSFRLPPESEVEKQLALLIIKVNKLFFGLPSAPETRASVFLVIGKKLQMCYRYGFEPGAADPPVFGFDQGLTGYAYTRLTRLYCNLGELTNLAATNPAKPPAFLT